MDMKSRSQLCYEELLKILNENNLDEFDIIPIENKETKFLLVDSKLAFNCQHVKELVVLLSKNFMAARKKMKTLKCLKNEKTIVESLANLSQCLLLFIPDHYTAWNCRKELIQIHHLEPLKDLTFTTLVLSKHPKNVETFSHRKWVINQILLRRSTAQDEFKNCLYKEPSHSNDHSTSQPTTITNNMNKLSIIDNNHTTIQTTTIQPTTIQATTIRPTTIQATPIQPTTIQPTTIHPTTIQPTTIQPTTIHPTTIQPTTIHPTTIQPTTIQPTTIHPTTIQLTTIQPTTSHSTSSCLKCLLLPSELSTAYSAACHYPNNYHAWNHRLWALQTLSCFPLKMVTSELEATDAFMSQHVSEYTAYHHRQCLFNMLISGLIPTTSTGISQQQNQQQEKQHFHQKQQNQQKQQKQQQNMEHISPLTTDLNSLCGLLLQDFQSTEASLNFYQHSYQSLFYHKRFLIFMMALLLGGDVRAWEKDVKGWGRDEGDALKDANAVGNEDDGCSRRIGGIANSGDGEKDEEGEKDDDGKVDNDDGGMVIKLHPMVNEFRSNLTMYKNLNMELNKCHRKEMSKILMAEIRKYKQQQSQQQQQQQQPQQQQQQNPQQKQQQQQRKQQQQHGKDVGVESVGCLEGREESWKELLQRQHAAWLLRLFDP